jgi:GNAT superfamily N-acetyltransferase
LNIIQATAAHTDLIAPLFDAYRQFYQAAPDLAAARQFILERLTNDESVIFLALEGKEVMGFTQLYPIFSSVAIQKLWLLNDLFVVPTARHKGIGEALVQRAEQLARDTGFRGLFLRTAVDNYPAQRLYERCGWVRDNQFCRYDLIVNA